ncbi:MAG: hypothetical protein LBB83_07050 [Treponema sp.]|jgi:hypothetical protein|nr:hypothetical protein [Treponema sp.]
MTDMDKAIEEARAAIMPFESWERLPGESGLAYAAFCAFRDFGPERNIHKAVEGQFRKAEPPNVRLEAAIAKKYRTWRNWATQFRWRERAADYDNYTDKLKQAERRKTIEAQGEKHRVITGKMLSVVEKKLDLMNPADLTQGTVTEWVEAAIRAEREAGQFADANCLGVSTNRNSMPKQQGEINFTPEFEGL